MLGQLTMRPSISNLLGLILLLSDRCRQRQMLQPPDILHASRDIDILGVTWANGLSARHQQMCAVVVLDPSTTHSRLEWPNPPSNESAYSAELIRDVHGFSPPNLPSVNEQCVAADEKLFKTNLLKSYDTLHCLLPPFTIATENYNLRPITQQLYITLPKHTGYLNWFQFSKPRIVYCVVLNRLTMTIATVINN